MTARSAWVSGNGQGLAWGAAFSSEAATTSSANSVLSSITVANGTALDQFMDVSVKAGITSSTITSGANIALWVMILQEDGSTFGDGSLTTTPSSVTPALVPVGVIPARSGSSMTTIVGNINGIVIPPGTFSLALQNNVGFNFSSCTVDYRTYNINLNS